MAYSKKIGFRIKVEEYIGPEMLCKVLDRLRRVVEAYQRLRSYRFGLIGGVSPWLIYSKLSPIDVREPGLGKIAEILMKRVYDSL